MTKWFVYIVFLMILLPRVLSASNFSYRRTSNMGTIRFEAHDALQRDTSLKKRQDDDKKKIKEVAKAKKQPKPEKIEEIDPETGKPIKPKRQRRPEGLERPPEIPRRNNN